MTTCAAHAPGKVILFGEHAVVYGQPALAVPVERVQAMATVEDGPAGGGLMIDAAALSLRLSLAEAAQHGLALAAELVLKKLGHPEPDALITVTSTIPMAAGLGSGAAVSAALARALAAYLGQPLDDAALSALVYEVEKFYHGTPSGIDNTVICYGEPVYFIREQSPQLFRAGAPFHLLIGDTGISSPTRLTVGAVREAWTREPARYEAIFEQVGQVAREAREAIEAGQIDQLGPLMGRNQALLRQLAVSSPELERLIDAALAAGAQGAKLSGGGGGGNMIALVAPQKADEIGTALEQVGAVRVLHTVVQ